MIEITTEYTEVRFNGAYYAQVPTASLATWLSYAKKLTVEQAKRQGMTLHPVTERYVVFYQERGMDTPVYEPKQSKLAAVRAYNKILRSAMDTIEVGWAKQRSIGEGWTTA